MTKKLIPVAIIIAGVLIAGAIYYVNKPGEVVEEVLTSQEAAEKAINFINQNLLGGAATASLIEVSEEIGLYKIKFDIDGREIESYLTRDGKFLFPEAIDLTQEIEEPTESTEPTGVTIGNFSVSGDEVCKENGKPIIYFFGSQGCGYCNWEHPVMEAVALRFEEYIAFHNNMDSDADKDIFSKYSTGGIPTLVFGCKYSRVGAGTQSGEELEAKNLTALICKLTDGQPADVCSRVQDLIDQIEL